MIDLRVRDMTDGIMSQPEIPAPKSIYAKLYDRWPQAYADSRFDHAAFERKISRCNLANCRGMCCYDGVYIEYEVKVALDVLIEDRRSDLAALGAVVPNEAVVVAEWRGEKQGYKTATKPYPFSAAVSDYPSHFNETACVFHMDDGRCALQALAVQDGRHPWDYKPPSCWLHPIDLSGEVITLYDETNDPYNLPGYPGYVSQTVCGRSDACGAKAVTILSEELEYLSRLIGRPVTDPTFG